MTDGPLRSARAALSRFGIWNVVRVLAVIAACGLAYNGARILNDSSPTQAVVLDRFDESALWLALALIALVVAAWEPKRFRLDLRQTATTIWNEHYLEVLLFVAIILAGVFMRFFRFGDTLPPEIGLCCEEHINGGRAYEALQGDRTLLFPLVRWTSALGFLTFGETTMGLRFFFPVMGIATLVVFYFLLRQLVRVQAALFGLALYAVAWWPSLRSRQTTGGTIYAVLFAFFAVRAMKTKNPLWFLATGVVAGLMSYEYEAFRPIPMIAVGVAVLLAAREVSLGGAFAQARARAAALIRTFWRPVLFFLLAAGIVLVPMIIGTHQGKDLYLTSVHRNEEAREGSRLADEWPDQLRWASTMFLPLEIDFPTSPPRDIEGQSLFDPLTATLVVAAMAAGVVFLWRGYRSWLVVWVVSVLVGGALLLGEFAPWSFLGVVPILFILIAYFVDDIGMIAARYGSRTTRPFTAILAVAVAFVFWWNADTLFNDVAPDPEVQRVYGGESSFMYAMCDYLRDRPVDNYSFAYSNVVTVDGFAAPRATEEQENRAWSVFIWACHGLEGAALPAAQEAWPLRDVPEGPVTLAFADPLGDLDELIAELNLAYPGLGDPDRRITGPGETYEFLAYSFASGRELGRRGLWGTYTDAAGTTETQIDFADGVGTASSPFDPPFEVQWTGLVYVDTAQTAEFRVGTDHQVTVLVDGEPGSLELRQGWHTVEVMLSAETAGGQVSLEWVDEQGQTTPVASADLFPLEELTGWLHTRSMGFAGDQQATVTQRLDFSPHLALARVLQLASPTGEETVTEERWEGVFDLDQTGDFNLTSRFRAGTVTILIDGETVATREAGAALETVLQRGITLKAGAHTIELVQELERGPTWSGATLSITDAAGRTPVIRPY